jgi:hypothetical protein
MNETERKGIGFPQPCQPVDSTTLMTYEVFEKGGDNTELSERKAGLVDQSSFMVN